MNQQQNLFPATVKYKNRNYKINQWGNLSGNIVVNYQGFDVKVWAGGKAEDVAGLTELAYLLTLQKGMQVNLSSFKQKDDGTWEGTIVVPPGFQVPAAIWQQMMAHFGGTAAQVVGAPVPGTVPGQVPGQAVPGAAFPGQPNPFPQPTPVVPGVPTNGLTYHPTEEESEPVYRGWKPMQPNEWLLAHLFVEQTAQIWGELYRKANEMTVRIGAEVSNDKVAEIATTWFIEMNRSGVLRQSFDPEQLDMRTVLDAAGFKARMETHVIRYGDKGKGKPTDKMTDSLISGLSKLFPDDETRHKITNYLFGKPSTKTLTYGEVSSLLAWMDTTEDRGWLPRTEARVQAWVLTRELGLA